MPEENPTEAALQNKRSRISAGLLLFRKKRAAIEFLLVHPGGPFFARKDAGTWTIPKGEVAPGEDLLQHARREFEEEIGCPPPPGTCIPLGSIKQRGGKIVHAWALEGDLPTGHVVRSNTFEIEWPPRSGETRRFPEIDHAEFFPEELARAKINPAQLPLLEHLQAALREDRRGSPA
ncbi:MAG: NUDIX domain-containing protein [Chthoniobacterales bacterium]